MKLLQNRRQWQAFRRDLVKGQNLEPASPTSFPCYVYTTVASWGAQWEDTNFLYPQDLAEMAESLRRRGNAPKPRVWVKMFADDFAFLIANNVKRQTVRALPEPDKKHYRPKAGDVISCRRWTGRPYNSKQEILREEPLTRVALCTIWRRSKPLVIVGGSQVDADDFARADGFPNAEALLAYFETSYGLPFQGIALFW